MPGGRPPKWTDPKVVEQQGLAFFEECIAKKMPLTITGLALALETTRQTLIDYEEKDEFLDTIKRLKSMCENYAEQQAFIGKNPGGAIFSLKNFGWRDQQHTDVTTGGEKVSGLSPALAAVIAEAEQKLKESL